MRGGTLGNACRSSGGLMRHPELKKGAQPRTKKQRQARDRPWGVHRSERATVALSPCLINVLETLPHAPPLGTVAKSSHKHVGIRGHLRGAQSMMRVTLSRARAR